MLDLQLNAAGGTYVADNARLCFDASIAWAQRNDSLLVFERAVVCLLRARDVGVSNCILVSIVRMRAL